MPYDDDPYRRYPFRRSYFPATQSMFERRALRTSRPDLGIPEDLTAAQFTGQNIDRLRGTNLPYMSAANEALMARDAPMAFRGQQDLYAQAVGQRYRGASTIPQGANPGYYNKKGEYLGPTHDASGNMLPAPKGTTGVVGSPVAVNPATGNYVPSTVGTTRNVMTQQSSFPAINALMGLPLSEPTSPATGFSMTPLVTRNYVPRMHTPYLGGSYQGPAYLSEMTRLGQQTGRYVDPLGTLAGSAYNYARRAIGDIWHTLTY